MDRQPTLEGERLLLRPLREEDREALYAVARDPLLWAEHPDRERWREKQFAVHFEGLLARGGSLAVIDKSSGALIGVSRYQYGSPDNGGSIEIGSTFLARSHWGGAVNREMKQLLVGYALRFVEQVEFWAWQDNARSCRALEKIGARRLEQIEPVEVGGALFPHAVFEMTLDDLRRSPLYEGMDRQPTLEGERLLLRPLRPDDWDGLYAVASDPLVWELHPAHDRWQEPVFRAFFADALAKGGALAVIDKQTRAIVGSSRFQNLREEDGGSVEIGWTFLARRYWGGSINRELKRLMIAHALKSVERVHFIVGENNLRSRAAMAKIGGKLDDWLEIREMAGGPVRHVRYTIDRENFEIGPLSRP
jgi:RimJ/RimL family protein N-acetyltransferase